MKIELNNIAGCLVIDATGAFLNGAGLRAVESRNQVIPKTFKEKINGRFEEVPYVSAQAWRRWLRNTTNEENQWDESELKSISTIGEKSISNKNGKKNIELELYEDDEDQETENNSVISKNTNKISTELDPINFPEDDIFGYMRAGDKKEESVQRTSPFKSSILKGIKNLRSISQDNAFVHLKEGTPLPYSTKFYSAHLEGFFNLEYSRLGVYNNLGSKMELGSDTIKKYSDQLIESDLLERFKRYTLKNADVIRKERASGLLKGIVFLRGGAKQAAFGTDVSPKALIIGGLSSANPIFNNLFEGGNEKPILNIEALKELAQDYKDKLATPIYIGIRKGYLFNEKEVEALHNNTTFVVGSPVTIVEAFTKAHLSL